MAAAVSTIKQWLVFYLSGQRYAVVVEQVEELTMTRDKRIQHLSSSSVGDLGVLKLRDTTIPVIDMRSLLRMPTMADETQQVLDTFHAREQDHVKWLAELEACVQERREFTLATDPHRCKFGQWYDKVKTDVKARHQITNGDIGLERLFEQLLGQFDGPHTRIHAIAQQVTTHVKQGELDSANQIIEATRSTDLAAMMQIFAEARETIAELRHPLLMVVEVEEHRFGVLIDNVDSVAELEPCESQGDTDTHPQSVIGFALQDDSLTTLLDLEQLLSPFFSVTV